MEKQFDKGTVIRTVLLLLALINQTLIMLGYPIVEISEAEVTTLIESLYLVGSLLFSIGTTVIAYWKNNYVTEKGKKQQEVLRKEGLTK